MPNGKKDGMKKKLYLDLEIVLLSEMGFFTGLKSKIIKLKPKTNPIQQQPKTTNIKVKKEEKIVDLHFEITKKIDEIIAKNEKNFEEPEFITISEK